ncbi:MAG: SIR2 family NAD-dependent protein deacylase [Anaerolineales bacterium]
MTSANLQELITRLRRSKNIAALTGAGTSAESGVPTFRDAQTGLWARYDPQELATPQAFARDPRLVWEWYEFRRALVRQANPNPGHYALVELARHVPDFRLITQNVDGLHQRAGSPQVIELHGNILRTKCSREGRPIETWPEQAEIPPCCPNCGAQLRPDVVWFGESLPDEAIAAAWKAVEACEVFLSIGTSTVVEPAASLPFAALENGAVVVEINPQPTPLTRHATYTLNGPSGQVLPALLAAVWE